MKQSISPVFIVLALIVAVAGLVGAMVYATKPHTPAGIKYTPGVPPWKDKANGGTGTYNPRG
jgi:hypothetical protein